MLQSTARSIEEQYVKSISVTTFKYFLVILSVNENTLLIAVEGAQTPAGGRDRGDPATEEATEKVLNFKLC
ncbi:hypothetical protein AB685_00890 [Bacillus sp. LL01]|nr:hypothetical protein AB685_00890 [Bacillus sp. LL01]